MYFHQIQEDLQIYIAIDISVPIRIVCRGSKKFFKILPSKFAFWVDLNPTLWVAMGVRGANPSKWQLKVASGSI